MMLKYIMRQQYLTIVNYNWNRLHTKIFRVVKYIIRYHRLILKLRNMLIFHLYKSLYYQTTASKIITRKQCCRREWKF